MSAGNWTTIESDPGVFTELIARLGVKGVQVRTREGVVRVLDGVQSRIGLFLWQVEELYSLDVDSLRQLEPIYGLIFLFKWQPDPRQRETSADYEERDVFFAKQVITNACATQAILGVLLNHPELEIGAELSQFREFTQGFSSELKGLAISNSDAIREVHNSFTPPHALLPEIPDEDDEKGEAFHFVAYTWRSGAVWELDGLQQGPICLGECAEEAWTERAAAVINERIALYAASEIKFSLLALVKCVGWCRRTALEEQLAENWVRSAQLEESLPGSASPAREELARCRADGARLSSLLDEENRRRAQWSEENLRRRTDYVPAIFNLLRALAAEGELRPLVEAARAK
ncbi:hypothetical protein QBZ16_003898 [Prototheca wickerhamii]|uniref:Ubiquitin carboxyl-terminal hydrolase n=1 Tax=Prototheca wickerhamii TaxID=3111 RepID=A0AAD9MKF7_PROWI|nr:hypothetical protein QBZ16_003898 [Prototheca wickerhamii]